MIVHVEFAPTGELHVPPPAMPKSPLATIPSVRLPLVLFFNVTVSGGVLVVPTACEANVRLVGVKVTGAIAVPVRSRIC